jgi:rod shape-determining protein MreD
MNGRRGGWPLWLVLGLLVLLHFYLRPRFFAGRGAPDFLLLALLIFSIRSRPGTAAVAGLLVGLVNDTLSPAHFGAGMLSHTLVGYLAAWGRAVFFAGTWLRNLVILLASGLSVGALMASLTLWSTLQAATSAAAGVVVVLVIRHRVDFRIDE